MVRQCRMRLTYVAALLCACSPGQITGTDSGGTDAQLDLVIVADAVARDEGVDRAVDSGVDAQMPARARLMYVSVGNSNELQVVELAADGQMTAMTSLDLALPENPGAMAYARTNRRLYIGFPNAVATVELSEDGRPTLAGQTRNTGRPVYVGLAHSGTVLVSAYFGDNRLRTHNVMSAPPHTELDTESTRSEPHAAYIWDSDRVYVPHRTGERTEWWTVTRAGELTFNGGIDERGGEGPRHIALTPDGRYAYVANEFGDNVAAHMVSATGALTHLQTLSTLPVGTDGGSNTCADVHITPDGRFVYVSNRGHDSLAGFRIGTDGRLTDIGIFATESTPREFDISPDSRFAVAAGQGSGFLQSYQIETNGVLTSVDRHETGGRPSWVIID